ncbi:serine/threonine-protein kinase AFC2 isoform X1 [Canna indica]|uniref:Serine/threonine-protein kinase AFC2 isoform X1 n=1 Tax=Canna indica TaxID=4628 RepID=A0AAQ3K3I6_9LILI|nr:serine/threonine-protein kinase AFC2 isoform X1 [Canna indica]
MREVGVQVEEGIFVIEVDTSDEVRRLRSRTQTSDDQVVAERETKTEDNAVVKSGDETPAIACKRLRIEKWGVEQSLCTGVRKRSLIACMLKARMGMLCGQEINLKSLLSLGTTFNDTCSSHYMKGLIQGPSPPWREDDKDGHYKFELGENLNARYKIHGKMGEGTFGQVLECWDREREEMVAIKIVRGINKYREAAMIEIDMLQQLGKCDKSSSRCVQIRNWFKYLIHICIVFEKLRPSLYEFIRKNSYRSFPIDLVHEFARQLLECVTFMHDMRLIHTDLKPETILLVSPEYIKNLCNWYTRLTDYHSYHTSPAVGALAVGACQSLS